MTDEEVRGVVAIARHNSETHMVSDPTYAELMATYAELGDLLVSGRTDAEYVQDVRAAASTAARLSGLCENESQQRVAIFWARVNEEAA